MHHPVPPLFSTSAFSE